MTTIRRRRISSRMRWPFCQWSSWISCPTSICQISNQQRSNSNSKNMNCHSCGHWSQRRQGRHSMCLIKLQLLHLFTYFCNYLLSLVEYSILLNLFMSDFFIKEIHLYFQPKQYDQFHPHFISNNSHPNSSAITVAIPTLIKWDHS